MVAKETANDKTSEIASLQEEIDRLKKQNEFLTTQGSELIKVQTIHQSLLHSATDPIIQFDEDGLVVNFNSAAQSVFGFSEIELMYQSADTIIPCPPGYNGKVPDFLLDCMQQNLATDGVLPIMAVNAKGEQFCMECSISEITSDDMTLFDDEITLFDDEGTEGDSKDPETGRKHKYDSVMLILRDVSQRINSEKILLEAMNKTEKALAVKSEFIATISHELRTPMNGIIGGLQLIKDTQLNQEQSSLLNTIFSSSESLLSIINSVLDFSKLDAGKMELAKIPFSLIKVVEEIIEMFMLVAEKKQICLKYSISSDFPKVLIGDQVKLRQILINLMGNAIKFTEQGFVDIVISSQQSTDSQHLVFIKIKDTGIGIAEENQQQLFKPFIQADNSITRDFGGTGLGLSISKKIVDLMQGSISLESEVGKGTTFSLSIPFEYTEDDTAGQLFSENVFMGKTILILTKNKRHAEILSTRCEHWGLETSCCFSEDLAIEKLSRTNYDWLMIEPVAMDENLLIEFLLQLKNKPPLALIGKSAEQEIQQKKWHKLDHKYIAHPVLMTDLRDSLVTREEINEEKEQQTQKEINSVVCITDDNAVNRAILKKILTKLGCNTILTANDGLEVIDLTKINDIKLIFMDLQMPNMGGVEACKKILGDKEAATESPVIIALTANVSEEDKRLCAEAGMLDFLSKPVRMEKIQSILTEYL